MINRVTDHLKTNHGLKVFILYGDNIIDSFIHNDLTITNINHVLERYLFEKEFDKLFFYHTSNRLTEKSKEKQKIEKQSNKHNTPKKRINLREKTDNAGSPPLDYSILSQKTESKPELTRIHNSGWTFILEHLNAVMLKNTEKSAIIFTDAHNMNIKGCFNADFASKFSDWIVNSNNKSIIFFLFVNNDLTKIMMPDYLRNHISEEKDIQILRIGGIGKDELSRLIQRKRIVDGFHIDWTIHENALDVLSQNTKVTDSKLNEWLSDAVLGKEKHFNLDLLKRLKSENEKDEKKHLFMQNIEANLINQLTEKRDMDSILREVNQLIGLQNIKTFVNAQIYQLKQQIREKEMGYSNKEKKSSLHMVFTGNPGTGKTTIARKFGEIFKFLRKLKSGHVIETDSAGLIAEYVGQTAIKTREVVESAFDGVLFIDEAYTLTNSQFGKDAIDQLVKMMEDNKERLVVIVAGYTQEMKNFIDANPGLKSRFTQYVHFDDYNEEELYQIFKLYLNKTGKQLSAQADKKVKLNLKFLYETRDKNFGNARDIRNFFDSVLTSQQARLGRLEQIDHQMIMSVEEQDVPQLSKDYRDLETILNELNELTGLKNVKDEIKNRVDSMAINKKRNSSDSESDSLHLVFTGNPGTGKTTVARKMGEIYRALGILKKGHLIEVRRSDLIQTHVGETAKQVERKVNEALDGVLFIDEAYTISNGDQFGQEAIDTLLPLMENYRSRLVVIVAGYTKEMNDFIKSNDGLKSRFTKYIHFDDYNTTELEQILTYMIRKEGFMLSNPALEGIKKYLTKNYSKPRKGFGNAREMRNLVQILKESQAKRLIAETDHSEERLTTIEYDDIPDVNLNVDVEIKKIQDEIDTMVGLKNVKDFIDDLVSQVLMEKELESRGIKNSGMTSLHCVFYGNPGTGKTTIARKMGEIFRLLGILPKGQLIETDSSGLVAGYVGQTAIKTREKVEEALDGVLFIDEAYTLTEKSDHSFGGEAIGQLIKMMEDYRENLIVIVAGYTQNMKHFMDTNPGLSSRFTQYIEFEDYSPDELFEIFNQFVSHADMFMTPSFSDAVKYQIEQIYHHRKENFGNAREIRNLFESLQTKQKKRLKNIRKTCTNEQLMTFEIEDIESLFSSGNQSQHHIEETIQNQQNKISLSEFSK